VSDMPIFSDFINNSRTRPINELKERISQYINQINEKPVLFTWRYKMEERDEMPGGITI